MFGGVLTADVLLKDGVLEEQDQASIDISGYSHIEKEAVEILKNLDPSSSLYFGIQHITDQEAEWLSELTCFLNLGELITASSYSIQKLLSGQSNGIAFIELEPVAEEILPFIAKYDRPLVLGNSIIPCFQKEQPLFRFSTKELTFNGSILPPELIRAISRSNLTSLEIDVRYLENLAAENLVQDVQQWDFRYSIEISHCSQWAKEMLDRCDEKEYFSIRNSKLTSRSAQNIARFTTDMQFDRLENLSGEVAAFLTSRECDLNLDGLTQIDLETAQQLGAHRGRLSLRHLKNVSDLAIEGLSTQVGSLSLTGLSKLTLKQAQSLGKHTGELYLDGLTDLSLEAAQALSGRNRKNHFELSQDISMSTALTEFIQNGTLSLRGLNDLSDGIVEALARHQGNLHFGTLVRLTDSQIECFFDSFQYQLSIEKVWLMSKEGLEKLQQRFGSRSLWNASIHPFFTCVEDVLEAFRDPKFALGVMQSYRPRQES